MKAIIPILLFSFLATPWTLINDMIKATSTPHKKMTISGVDSDGASATIIYDRKVDRLSISMNGEEKSLKGNEIELWQRLFFLKEEPKKTDNLVNLLRKAGIDTSKKMLSVTAPAGELIYILGKEKAEENVPFIAIYKRNNLPFRIFYNNMQITFSDYAKSVLPLAFPGTIEFKNDEKVEKFTFLRKEFSVD